MQENVGNITFVNDGKVEFENASVEINNVELFGEIYVADLGIAIDSQWIKITN
jgi:hypothetical protein